MHFCKISTLSLDLYSETEFEIVLTVTQRSQILLIMRSYFIYSSEICIKFMLPYAP